MLILALKILAALSILILIIGLIKPKWILFWMKTPDRLSVTALAMLLFMAAWTGIAKLTLKPKETKPVETRQMVEERNELQLENR